MMRMSGLFGSTLREVPAEAEIPSHQLMVRAGMIKRLAAGIYSYMPLLYRTLRKIQDIIREEMDAIGGQEINMPVVHPAELWQESGRWYDVGPEMARFKDRGDRDMVLAMTHEEVVTDLVRNEVSSYRQLPMMLYQIQTKFRDEPRARGGLIRVREFTMKDAYSFHTDLDGLDEYYEEMVQAYLNICWRSGLDVAKVKSDTGMMGGTDAHEFMYLTGVGEDSIIVCKDCSYAANLEVAEHDKGPGVTGGPDRGTAPKAEPKELEVVETPGKNTIADVAEFLGVKSDDTVKSMVYAAKGKLVIVVIRGDLQISEKKLVKAVGDPDVRPATDEEVAEAGLKAGFLSPVNLEGFWVIADDSVTETPNLVAGANKVDHHYINANYGRDFKAHSVVDLSEVQSGHLCPDCGGQLEMVNGIEVGNTFKLGYKYSKALNATFQTDQGKDERIAMGSYGIGVGRLAACVVEQHHDEDGIIWPMALAPYHVAVVPIGREEENYTRAEELAREMEQRGIEVLLDDRDISPGVKLKDADLIGLPIRVLISGRSLKQDAAEVKLRAAGEAELIAMDQVIDWVRQRVTTEIESYRDRAVRLEKSAIRR